MLLPCTPPPTSRAALASDDAAVQLDAQGKAAFKVGCVSSFRSLLCRSCPVFFCGERVGCPESPRLLITLFTKHSLAVLMKIKRTAKGIQT